MAKKLKCLDSAHSFSIFHFSIFVAKKCLDKSLCGDFHRNLLQDLT